jgi:CubicO group peptidase (beta-lactamase class C family)
MKKALLALVMFSFSLTAQMADKQSHLRMADSIEQLFNSKRFKEIYSLITPDFKRDIQEKDLTDLLENGLYAPYGKITNTEFLRKDTGYYVFILHFEPEKIQMNIGVDNLKQIAYFQFIPYKEALLTKREKFLSDNKKQNRLDSVADKVLSEFMADPKACGVSVAVFKNGKEHFYNYGETKRNSEQLPSSNTIYEIGSISKTFCGILLAKAVQENKIKLEDDIRNYLPGKYPDLSYNGVPIRVKNLVNHTCALPKIPEDMMSQPGFDPLDPYKHYTKQMVYNYLKTVKLTEEPGTSCKYSNFGMGLLGIILEEVYKKPFESLVKEKICNPAHMISTGINLDPEQSTRFAEGYNEEGAATPHWDLGALPAAGALRSTSRDMLAYTKYNLDEKDSAVKLSHELTYKGRENVAMAWYLKKTKQGDILMWHSGGTYGFSSFCGFIKDKNCSVVVLSNRFTNVDYIGIAILDYLQK